MIDSKRQHIYSRLSLGRAHRILILQNDFLKTSPINKWQENLRAGQTFLFYFPQNKNACRFTWWSISYSGSLDILVMQMLLRMSSTTIHPQQQELYLQMSYFPGKFKKKMKLGRLYGSPRPQNFLQQKSFV